MSELEKLFRKMYVFSKIFFIKNFHTLAMVVNNDLKRGFSAISLVEIIPLTIPEVLWDIVLKPDQDSFPPMIKLHSTLLTSNFFNNESLLKDEKQKWPYLQVKNISI